MTGHREGSTTAMAAPATAIRNENERPANPESWEQALALECRMTVDMPLPGFEVGDMLRLKPGSVINSHWPLGADVSLHVNGRLIARGEFEVMGNHLAIRITDLA